MADYKARLVENQFSGPFPEHRRQEVLCRLVGSFNAYNLTATYAAAVQLGKAKWKC